MVPGLRNQAGPIQRDFQAGDRYTERMNEGRKIPAHFHPVEFEIVSGAEKMRYKNHETEISGTATFEHLRQDFGDYVAAYFKEKLG